MLQKLFEFNEKCFKKCLDLVKSACKNCLNLVKKLFKKFFNLVMLNALKLLKFCKNVFKVFKFDKNNCFNKSAFSNSYTLRLAFLAACQELGLLEL